MADHPSTTVIRSGTVWTGGGSPELHPRADLIIEDGVVAAIEEEYRGHADVELDAEGCIVTPGLVNCHTHIGCTPTARGVSEDLALHEEGAFYHSLVPLLTLANSTLSDEEFAAVIEWDAIAMLLGGATTIVEENFGGAELWMHMVERLGCRSYLGLTYPGNAGAIGYIKDGKLVKDDATDLEGVFRKSLRLHDDRNGAFGDRLRIHLSPHASDTVPRELLMETQREAQARGITVHLHLAQHLSENRAIAERVGKSPVEYLADIGFLGPNVLATHVTYTERTDWDILAHTKTNVIHCSYRKGKEGLMSPFWEYLERGVNVAMATDSFSHDLVEDMRLAAIFGKVRQQSVGRPTAPDVLTSATHRAAVALNRPDLGHLRPGARGDALVVSLTSPYAAPVFDPLRALIYYTTGSDVRHSVVNGQPVVRDHEVVNSDHVAVARAASAACHRLWEVATDQGGVLPAGTSWYLLNRSLAHAPLS